MEEELVGDVDVYLMWSPITFFFFISVTQNVMSGIRGMVFYPDRRFWHRTDLPMLWYSYTGFTLVVASCPVPSRRIWILLITGYLWWIPLQFGTHTHCNKTQWGDNLDNSCMHFAWIMAPFWLKNCLMIHNSCYLWGIDLKLEILACYLTVNL